MRYILVYGIACVEEKNGMWETLECIPDVTCKREEAERLVELFNRLNLSRSQLYEAVEDLLE